VLFRSNLRVAEALPQKAEPPRRFSSQSVVDREQDFLAWAAEHGAQVGGATGAGGDSPKLLLRHSETGEIDRFDGPYYLGMLLVLSPLVLPLPLPGNGVAPLNVVPVDFVVEATWVLARNPDAVGKTVHLVDPNPMSARRVYELIA
jgi:uncharacterized protein YbjT (DUF2867 family)